MDNAGFNPPQYGFRCLGLADYMEDVGAFRARRVETQGFRFAAKGLRTEA